MTEPNNDPKECTESGIPRSPLMMSRNDSAVLVVDVQEKLVPLIQNHNELLANIELLIQGAEILGVPKYCTEQYPKGLGETVEPIKDYFSDRPDKSLFSCRQCETIVETMRESNRQKLLIVGIETHVCILQTALDFLSLGYDVCVAVDAVGSRFQRDADVALRRMELSGVTLTTTESALFEWCETSEAPEFKRISQLAKSR